MRVRVIANLHVLGLEPEAVDYYASFIGKEFEIAGPNDDGTFDLPIKHHLNDSEFTLWMSDEVEIIEE